MRFRFPLPVRALAFVAAAGLTLTACDTSEVASGGDPLPTPPTAANGDIIPGHYIVVLKPEVGEALTGNGVRAFAAEFATNAVVYESALQGFAAPLTDEQLDELRSDPRVGYIEPDRLMILKKPNNPGNGGGGGGGSSQSTPYGIARVNGGVASNGVACVLDSGVDLDHPDLNVDRLRSRTFITSGRDSRSADDLNGHGTHVAGTIAAVDNTTGVIGVAAGATIVAVKVLDRNGSGSYSGVIDGVDYVASGAAGCSVANMSLGGPVSPALDQAVLNAGAAGVTMVLAAGNESQDATNSSPARAGGAYSTDNVYAISAINSSDMFASFSNFGSAVAYAAPGVGVTSTWKGGGYATISGTSMAAPHAAGVFLLGNARTSGTAMGDPDGNPDPIIVH